MNSSQLNRVLGLVRRTGDRVVIMDSETDEVFVLAPLANYEKLLTANNEAVERLTEEELLEKINRDVAVWKAYNEKQQLETYDEVMEKPLALRESPSVYPRGIMERGKPITLQVAPQPAPMEPPAIDPGEPLADLKSDDEEEKFYLEPLE